MKKSKGPKFDKQGYETSPFGRGARFGKPVKDVLPPPGKLRLKVPREDIDPVDIWVPISPKSLAYFKRRAKREQTDYHAVIAAFIEEHLPTR